MSVFFSKAKTHQNTIRFTQYFAFEFVSISVGGSFLFNKTKEKIIENVMCVCVCACDFFSLTISE